MSDNDPFVLAFDASVHDRENRILVEVVLCDQDSDSLQFRLKSGSLDIPFFLQLDKARQLVTTIQDALKIAEVT